MKVLIRSVILGYAAPGGRGAFAGKVGRIVVRWAMWGWGRGCLGHAQRGFFLAESYSQNAM